jgi:hypothetical protein
MKRVVQFVRDVARLVRLPRLSIDLMHAQTRGNDPFYDRVVREFWDEATRRHRKLPLVSSMTHGVAVCPLPPTYEAYVRLIEPAGHRNCRKAERLGYRFERIDYNRYLADIGAIRRSTDVRQGEMPADLLEGEIAPCVDPPSRTATHDYAHYGIVRDGTLWAYAGCLISGELCMLEHILGHAARLNDGIVPLLITGIGRELYARHPSVRCYAYGTFFGGGPSMRRFKTKFGFLPHRVDWRLGAAGAQSVPA